MMRKTDAPIDQDQGQRRTQNKGMMAVTVAVSGAVGNPACVS
jgi:hypothetical protein